MPATAYITSSGGSRSRQNFAELPDISWFLGNTYRDNSITGPAEPASSFVNPPVGISISCSTGTTNDSSGILMNVFDQNTVSNFSIGMQLYYNSGIVDAVLANDFFSSDGSIGSIGLSTASTGGDTFFYPSFDFATDTWQSFLDSST